ncbi:hypothetical protein ACRBEV_10255 [Methylobacterium phyllosphaerae]
MPVETSRFLENLKRRIEVEMQVRVGVFQEQSGLIKRQAAAAGSFGSGNTIKRLVDLAIIEQRDRCKRMTSLLSETWTSFEPPVVEAAAASGILRDSAQVSSDALSQSILTDSLTISMGGAVGALVSQLREDLRLSSEDLSLRLETWEAAIKNAKSAAQVRQRTVVNLTGNNNIVQAGTVGSSLQVSLSADTKESLREALVQLRAELLQSSALSEGQRRDHVELVEECLQEIEREEPNKLRLGSLLQTVAMSIQTIGAAGPAYEAMKVVAALMGIPLP